jgi:hypothetical protein
MNQIKPKKNKNEKALVYTVQTLSKTLKKMETHLSLLTPPAQLPRAAPRLYPVARALPCPTARAAPLPSRSHHALPSRSHRALPRLAAASTCSCLSRRAPTQPLSPRLAQPLTPRPAQAGRCYHLLVPLPYCSHCCPTGSCRRRHFQLPGKIFRVRVLCSFECSAQS